MNWLRDFVDVNISKLGEHVFNTKNYCVIKKNPEFEDYCIDGYLITDYSTIIRARFTSDSFDSYKKQEKSSVYMCAMLEQYSLSLTNVRGQKKNDLEVIIYRFMVLEYLKLGANPFCHLTFLSAEAKYREVCENSNLSDSDSFSFIHLSDIEFTEETSANSQHSTEEVTPICDKSTHNSLDSLSKIQLSDIQSSVEFDEISHHSQVNTACQDSLITKECQVCILRSPKIDKLAIDLIKQQTKLNSPIRSAKKIYTVKFTKRMSSRISSVNVRKMLSTNTNLFPKRKMVNIPSLFQKTRSAVSKLTERFDFLEPPIVTYCDKQTEVDISELNSMEWNKERLIEPNPMNNLQSNPNVKVNQSEVNKFNSPKTSCLKTELAASGVNCHQYSSERVTHELNSKSENSFLKELSGEKLNNFNNISTNDLNVNNVAEPGSQITKEVPPPVYCPNQNCSVNSTKNKDTNYSKFLNHAHRIKHTFSSIKREQNGKMRVIKEIVYFDCARRRKLTAIKPKNLNFKPKTSCQKSPEIKQFTIEKITDKERCPNSVEADIINKCEEFSIKEIPKLPGIEFQKTSASSISPLTQQNTIELTKSPQILTIQNFLNKNEKETKNESQFGFTNLESRKMYNFFLARNV